MSPRILTGPRFVAEALRAPNASRLVSVHVDARLAKEQATLIAEAERLGLTVKLTDRRALDRLAGDDAHRGVVALAAPFDYVEIETLVEMPAPLLVALDEITDPHNFGAIVRSAMAFGVDGVLVPKHRSASVTQVVVRASAGAVEHAAIAQVTNLQRTLLDLREDHGFEIFGLAADGDLSVDALPRQQGGRVLVVGSEGAGLRRLVRERCEACVRIPQSGKVESLNASVAAAIALYELSRVRG